MENQEFTRIYDHRIISSFEPKQPSPRTPIDKETHDLIYNQGWNDAMSHLKAVGRI